ncbi:hypothetical protein GCM10010452_81910 [Crossiella cryophila]
MVTLGVLLAITATLTGPLAAGLAGAMSGVAAVLFGSAALADATRGQWWTLAGAVLLATGTAASILLRT